jgi:hypothetical protein
MNRIKADNAIPEPITAQKPQLFFIKSLLSILKRIADAKIYK